MPSWIVAGGVGWESSPRWFGALATRVKGSPQCRLRVVDEGSGLAVDEGLHVADEAVRAPDVESGSGLEPGHEFGGQRDVQGTEVVLELIEAAHADDRVHGPRADVRASATCDALAPSSPATPWTTCATA